MIVLPEIFGLNGWVRGVADRLSATGVPALAMPLFARTAPDLELGYDPESTNEGRRHKEATTTAGILADVQASIDWLRQALGSRDQPLRITVVGFCFGGHAALLAATLADVHVSLILWGRGELWATRRRCPQLGAVALGAEGAALFVRQHRSPDPKLRATGDSGRTANAGSNRTALAL